MSWLWILVSSLMALSIFLILFSVVDGHRYYARHDAAAQRCETQSGRYIREYPGRWTCVRVP